MIVDKKLRRLDEFCNRAGLHDFRHILEDLFDMIESAGCQISARYDSIASSHEYSVSGCHIRISLSVIYTHPLHVIWNIFHEYGHHLSGKPRPGRLSRSEKLRREELAWDFAENLMKNYPELVILRDNFQEFKTLCLKSYEQNYI